MIDNNNTAEDLSLEELRERELQLLTPLRAVRERIAELQLRAASGRGQPQPEQPVPPLTFRPVPMVTTPSRETATTGTAAGANATNTRVAATAITGATAATVTFPGTMTATVSPQPPTRTGTFVVPNTDDGIVPAVTLVVPARAPTRLDLARHKLDEPFYGTLPDDTPWGAREMMKARAEIDRADAIAKPLRMHPQAKSVGAALRTLAAGLRAAKIPAAFLPGAIESAAHESAEREIATICAEAANLHPHSVTAQLDVIESELSALTRTRSLTALSSASAAFASACRGPFGGGAGAARRHIANIEAALADWLHLIQLPLSRADPVHGIAAAIIMGLPPTYYSLALRQSAETLHAAGTPLSAAAVLRDLEKNADLIDAQVAHLRLSTGVSHQTTPPRQNPPSSRHPTARVAAVVADEPTEADALALVLANSTDCKCEPARRRHEPGPECAQKCKHPSCIAAGRTHVNDDCWAQNPAARRDFRPRRN